jgi:hypothetical protein
MKNLLLKVRDVFVKVFTLLAEAYENAVTNGRTKGW